MYPCKNNIKCNTILTNVLKREKKNRTTELIG